MALVEMNWKPSANQLRQFGCVCLVAFPLLAWIWGGSTTWVGGAGLAGALLALLGFLYPRGLLPFFLAISLVTIPIGLVVGELAMTLIFFGVFLPIGMIFRILGRDALHRRLDRGARSYWQPKPRPTSVKSYYRQS